MIDHHRLLAITVALSLLGVLALFLYSTTIEPVSLGIDEVEAGHVGTVVRTNGTIHYTRVLSDGSLSIGLRDEDTGADIKVYVLSDAFASWEGGDLTPGTEIEVCGEVEIYQGDLEISVTSSEDMRVLSEAQSLTLELWQVLGSVDVLENMNLTTNGTVYDIAVIRSGGELVGTAFDLSARHENQTYSVKCIAFGVDLSSTLEERDLVSVTGTLSYYENGGCWQIVVDHAAPL